MVVTAGSGKAITDAAGHQWTIEANGLVDVDGVADTLTSRVTQLAYVGGKVWQENSSNLWWAKSSPGDQWSPYDGTSVSPLTGEQSPTVSAAPGSSSSSTTSRRHHRTPRHP
jgi:hypothetical protein